MSFKVKTLKAGVDFPVPPGKVVEKMEFYHSIRGVRQAVQFIGPEETEVEVAEEPEEMWLVPFFTNAAVAEDVVAEVVPEPPVEPAPLFPPTPAPEELVVDPTPAPTPEPTIPPTPAPEELVVDPTPAPTPDLTPEPTIPPTIDVATE